MCGNRPSNMVLMQHIWCRQWPKMLKARGDCCRPAAAVLDYSMSMYSSAQFALCITMTWIIIIK